MIRRFEKDYCSGPEVRQDTLSIGVVFGQVSVRWEGRHLAQTGDQHGGPLAWRGKRGLVKLIFRALPLSR